MMAAWRRAALQHFRVPRNGLHLVGELQPRCQSIREFAISAVSSAKKYFDVGQPSSETHPELLSSGEIMPGISSQEFVSRRQKLKEVIPTGSLVILAAAAVQQMTVAVPYPYRQDADYLYFTGHQQPGGIAVIDDSSDLCMFMPDPSPQRDLWEGRLADTLAAESFFGADRAYLLKTNPKDMVQRAKMILLDLSNPEPMVWNLPEVQEAVKKKQVQALQTYTHKIRWVKSPSEIKNMREVAAITCQAFMQTMLLSRHWPHERVLGATVEYECKIRGAQRMSFPPVVGGGANATVIHYSRNDKHIEHGDMVLMDAGCELHGYVSDMTRCWPPCGTFSDAQRDIYEVVLGAMKECFKLCRPKVSLKEIHMHSGLMLINGLLKLGLIADVNNLNQAYLQFNPTAVGHYLGMDVHDCAAVNYDAPLQPGVIISIEPSLFIPMDQNIPERYRGIGVRIEDEVLITSSGHEVLTASVPKEVEEIESWLTQRWSPSHPFCGS